MRRKTTRSEVRRYLQDWLDTVFLNGLINRHNREETLNGMLDHLPAIVAGLNGRGRARLKLSTGTLRLFLREGRDPTYNKFSLFEIQWPRKRRRRRTRKLHCFLGHRFLKSISNSLRLNLRYVLEPSNIKLDWAGMDIAAVGFFDDVIKKIRACDFCIFDNRWASEKPNVYIEAGIAYALGEPFILATSTAIGLVYPLTSLTSSTSHTRAMRICVAPYIFTCRSSFLNIVCAERISPPRTAKASRTVIHEKRRRKNPAPSSDIQLARCGQARRLKKLICSPPPRGLPRSRGGC